MAKRRFPKAGELRFRVVLEQDQAADGAQDDHGQEIENWLPIATVWADIRPGGGGESFRGGRVEATGEYEIELRPYSSLAPGAWRIVKASGDLAGTYYPVRVVTVEEKTLAQCRREE